MAYGVAVLFVSLIWAGTRGSTQSLPYYLGLIVVLICCVRIAQVCYQNSTGPVGLCFYLFVLVWIGVASLVQLTAGKLPWPDTLRTDLFAPAQLLTIVAIVSHSVGYGLRNRFSNVTHGRGGTSLATAWRNSPSLATTMLLVVLVAIPTIPFTGGISGRFTSREEYNDQLSSAGYDYSQGQSVQLGFLKILPSSIALVAVVVVVSLLAVPHKRLRDASVYLAFAVLLALSAVTIFANPISSTRFIAFSVVLSGGLALYQLCTPARRLLFSLAMLVGLTAGYPLAAWFKEPDASDRLPSLGTEAFLSVDFDGFQQVVNSIVYVERLGHSDGAFTASGLLYWLPRSVWLGKELPASYAVSAARNYPAQNLALPLWAEFYIDFSIVGMIILMVALGYISRRLDGAYAANKTCVWRTVALVVAGAEIGFLRGPIGAQIPFTATAILLALAVHLRTRRRDTVIRPGTRAVRTSSAVVGGVGRE